MTASASGAAKSAFSDRLVSWFLPLIIVAILLLMAVLEPRFYSRLNVSNILRNFTVTSLLALAQGLVMIVGGFDLSIGAIMAAASVTGALSMVVLGEPLYGQPFAIILLGFAVALAVGGVVGMINGLLVARLKASPFIITLGSMTLLSGLVFWYTKGAPVYGLPGELVSEIGRGRFFNLPVIFWFGLAVTALLWAMMGLTRFGRHVYAVGSNPTAARESGIAPTRVLVLIYGLSGVLAAAAGLILTARLGSGQSGIGGEAAIESIAAAVIAGVSLRGGVGSVPRIAISALFLALISNALNLAQIDSKFQTLVLGVFLIGFVAIERKFQKDV